jgi:hypothetical protein
MAKHTLGLRSYSPTALQNYARCPYRFFLQAIHGLVGISWVSQQLAAMQAAVNEVETLDRGAFSNPDIAGVLERIASKYSLEVATLEPSAIRGTRRGIERTVDDFGEARTITIEVMDVKIPFRGDSASFQFSPSSLTIPSQRCEVKNDHLVITLSDDVAPAN